MKNILKFVVLVVVSGLFSCNNDINENPNGTSSDVKNTDLAKKYLSFFRTKSLEGSILIQSSTTGAMQDINKNISLTEKKSRDYSKKSISSKHIEIKGFDYNSDLKKMSNKTKDENDFFGKVLYYRIVDNSKLNKSSSESNSYNEVYIPKLIDVSYNTENLIPGTIVSWNTDDLNENGVIVSVEYYAINQLDIKLAYDNPTTIKRSFVLDDLLGFYTITEQDLEIFPKNALLDINVLRAGFATDEESSLSIAGLTKVGDTKMAVY